MKPTVESILRSFQSSGKRHLLLTGSRGIGKSTRFRELLPLLSSEAIPGITSQLIQQENRRQVILREKGTANEALIGESSKGMQPVEAGFLDLGIPALERAIASNSPWIAIDELGFLESSCPAFQEAVLRCFEKKQVIAVLRKQDTDFLNRLRSREDVFLLDLDEAKAKIGIVLMASGKSRRFGSNKLLADFRGKPLICHILAATEDLFDRRIVVTRNEDVADLAQNLGAEVLLHQLPNRNDTIRLGTKALTDMDGLFFCPCDQPLLSRETLRRLLDEPYIHEDLLLRPCCKGRQGSPVFFGKSHFPALCTLPEKAGGSHILKQQPQKLRLLAIENELELMDIDSTEDMEKLNIG